jgi:hypothetical protein
MAPCGEDAGDGPGRAVNPALHSASTARNSPSGPAVAYDGSVSERKNTSGRHRRAVTVTALAGVSAAATMMVATPNKIGPAEEHYAVMGRDWLPTADALHLPEPSYSTSIETADYGVEPTPRPLEYSFATPAALGGHRNYRLFCKRVGLPATRRGYGFLHCVDNGGFHVTRLTEDVHYLRWLIQIGPQARAGLVIPPSKFPRKRLGWPDEWTLIAA